jgi:endonuclease YncB( thermonuclease family)
MAPPARVGGRPAAHNCVRCCADPCRAQQLQPPLRQRVAGALAALLVATAPVAASDSRTIVGTARLVDGDTLTLTADDGTATRVRLFGVDAPEKGQACADAAGGTYDCGTDATAALEASLGGLEGVACEVRGEDQYGRAVATCSGAAGVDAGATLVRSGNAVDLVEFSKGLYSADEAAAREGKAGLWRGAFMRPAQWRRAHRIQQLMRAAAKAGAAPQGAPGPGVGAGTGRGDRPVAAAASRAAEAAAATPDTAPPSPDCVIKGNIGARGDRIYFSQGDRLYDSVRINRPGERFFCTAADAEAAGWRPPRR